MDKFPFLVSEKTLLKVALRILALSVVKLSSPPKVIFSNLSTGSPFSVGTPLSIYLS